MKKNIFLAAFASVSALAVGLSVVLISRNNIKPLQASPAIQPGSITIDVNDEDIVIESNTFTAKSALGNEFTFETEGSYLTRNGGYFVLEGNLYNVTALNGVTSLTFTLPEGDQELRVDYGLTFGDEKYDNYIETKISPDDNVITFSEYNPTYFSIKRFADPFRFSRLVINYECVADAPQLTIQEAGSNKIGDYSLNGTEYCLYGEAGTNIVTSLQNTASIRTTNGQYISFNEYYQIDNLVVKYEEESLKDSTVVVEGSHNVSISFSYKGSIYSGTGLRFVGYDHLSFDLHGVTLDSSEILRTESDDIIPDGFTLEVHGYVSGYDSNDNSVFENKSSYKNNIPFSLDMIVSSDEHRFSTIGLKNMRIIYNGMNTELEYKIYDPDICNIQNIDVGTITVDAGTSKEDFIDNFLPLTGNVMYFNDDKSLPHQVSITSEHLVLTDGMFDKGNAYLNVKLNYELYEGYIYVHVVYTRGEIDKTYLNNEGGVNVFGQQIVKIELYKNGVCSLFREGQSVDTTSLYEFTIDGTTLTVDYGYGMTFKFTLNSDYTFERYQKEETPIETYDADLSAIGMPSSYTAEIKIYAGNNLVLTIDAGGGMVMDYESTYTVDPSDDKIIYFEINGGGESMNLKGTIDDGNKIITVEYA